MKRFFLLLIVLSCFRFSYGAELSAEQKQLAWKFIIGNMLSKNYLPVVYEKDIVVNLNGDATSEDSLFVKKLLDSFQKAIPRLKIGLSDKSGNLTLGLCEGQTYRITSNPSDLPDNQKIDLTEANQPIPDELTSYQRTQFIYYQLIRGLVICSHEQLEVPEMDGCVFAENDFMKITFSPLDLFILEQLYAPDFSIQLSRNLPNELQETGWKSIRLLFLGKPDDPKIFHDTLRVKLGEGFGRADSACFMKVFDELSKVIPLKIRLETKYADANLRFIPAEPGTLFSESSIKNKAGIQTREIGLFIPPDAGEARRMKIIYHQVYRSLVQFSYSSAGSQHIPEMVFCEEKPETITFHPLDKFILSKLYAPDLKKQFKEFFSATYGLNEYYKFRYGELLKTMSVAGSFLLAILILSILIGLKVFRRHNWSFRRFAIQLFFGIFVYSLVFMTYLTIRHFSFTLALNGFRSMLVNDVFIAVIAVYVFFVEKKLHFSALSEVLKQTLIVVHLFVALFLALMWYSMFLGVDEEYGRYVYPLMFALGMTTVRIFLVSFSAINQAEIKQKDNELARLAEKNKQAELQSLRAKINPHFLYNSLNSIASLAQTDARKTEQMALALSDFFKYSINREQKQMNSLSEELSAIRTYLEIEKVRFGDRLNFTIDCPEELQDIQIPQLLIQPLVENAIKHGLSQITGNGEIVITVFKENSFLKIRISDNGPAFPDGPLSGYGIRNTQERISLIYGKKASVNWQNGTEKYIEISVPVGCELV
ncbi:MAG: histidine kinase [Prolixibacteraceae bacterium]|nr:histidine kinase [Prolixibacteraceae bacterium]